MTREEKLKKQRELMHKYNATQKGAEYNRQHVKNWRKKNLEKAINYLANLTNG